MIAAHRAGCKTVILPLDNERDLDEVPEFVRKDLRFVLAEHVDEVLREALVKPLTRAASRRRSSHRTGRPRSRSARRRAAARAASA